MTHAQNTFKGKCKEKFLLPTGPVTLYIVLTRIETPGGTPRDPERPGLVPAMRLLFRPLNVGSVSPSNPAEELSLDPVAPEEPVSLLRARVARGLGLAGGAADVAKILFRGKALQGECQLEPFNGSVFEGI